MKVSVQISRGIEPLFGTNDENIRLLEHGLNIRTQLLDDCIELDGDERDVVRAETILGEYVELVREGQVFTNGDLNSYLHVVTSDPEVTLRSARASATTLRTGRRGRLRGTSWPALD
jgi:phosphate starvation-inducible PhoH-like protein